MTAQTQLKTPQVANPDYIGAFNGSIKKLFMDAVRITAKDPSMAFFAFQTLRRQNAAVAIRHEWEQRGTHVPPMMIVSVTHRCNLRCKGCYAHAHARHVDTEMTEEKLRGVLTEARELGISIIILAGGEPFARADLLRVTKDFPEIIFAVFTNGLLITPERIAELKRQKNVVPVISIEGHQEATDDRRGQGVYAHIMKTMAAMGEAGVFFGNSITVTRKNFDSATDVAFLKKLMTFGSRLFFLLDYVPVEAGTDDLILTDAQRTRLLELVAWYRAHLPGLFVGFPIGEEEFGGCLAAGRGFLHISPEGRVEPCPVSPVSDTNLKDTSLRDALDSRLLKAIRAGGDRLSETKGGCALFENRDWVNSLLQGTPEKAVLQEMAIA